MCDDPACAYLDLLAEYPSKRSVWRDGISTTEQILLNSPCGLSDRLGTTLRLIKAKPLYWTYIVRMASLMMWHLL